MPTYIALLRAVNVGGTGKLPMADLRAACRTRGFTNVRTYLASGNLVVESRLGAAKVREMLEVIVAELLGKPATVLVRRDADLAALLDTLPFPEHDGAKVLLLFTETQIREREIATVATPDGEQLVAMGSTLCIYFPNGMGRSRLKIPYQDVGTGRNLNTVRALLAMARGED